MMKKSILILLACMVGTSGIVMADDFGTGIEVEATKKVNKKLKVSLSGEFRTQDGVSDVERYAVGIDASYKFFKKKGNPLEMSAAAGYTFIDRSVPAKNKVRWDEGEWDGEYVVGYWSQRHRAHGTVTASYKIGKRWTLSLRERYQFTHSMADSVKQYKTYELTHQPYQLKKRLQSVGGKDKAYLRSRLQLKWERKRCPWEPAASIEVFDDVKDGFKVNQLRYTIGTDYNLDSNNTFGIAYRYKDKEDSDEAKGHLVKLSYTYKF